MIVQSPFYMSLDHIPKNVNVVDFLLNESKKFGNDIALIDSESKWQCSYAQLPSYIAQFQKVFESNGIKNGDHVALISLNCPEFIFSNLAIASLGAVSVCINPLSTAYELTYYLNLADCKHAVVHKTFQQKLIDAKCESTLMKNVITMPSVTELNVQNLDLVIKGTSRSFIINFSSGTTGKPKAVKSFHRSLVANITLTSQIPWYPAKKSKEQERSLMVIPLFHGYGGIMVYHSLYNGEIVVTMSRFKQKEFLQTLQDYKITSAFLVAPIIQFLATNSIVSNFNLSHFKSITSGASPLAPEIAIMCRNRLNLEDVRMIYGMSEIRTPTWLPYGSTNAASIGMLLPNTKLKVVDPKTGVQIIQPGQIGELWFTGVQVLEGEYYKNEEANRNFYVKDGETVWARTGDCGHFDNNGFVYLTDRYKDLIKYKGFQISPFEVEHFIRTHHGVLDCAVVGQPDPEAGELPTAFVVAKENMDIKKIETELQREIKEKLSTYKQLKGGIFFISEIPRSTSGKLSRASLLKNIKKNDSKL